MTLTATATSGLPVSFTSNSAAGVCIVSGGSVTLLSVGVCSITASQAGNATFAAAAVVTRTFNVTQNPNSITFLQPADTALTAGPVFLTASATSGLLVSYTSNSNAVCTVSGPNVTLVSVGVCSISANQAGNTNFVAAAPVIRTFNVLQGAQTINFTQPPDTALSAGPVSLTATATSGLPVIFTTNSGPICTVVGNSVTLASVGVCSITASQIGNPNFAAATPVIRFFNVTANTNVITFPQPVNTALTAGPVVLTATATSGLAVSYATNSAAVCTVSGASVTLVSVGVCSITANQAGNASFSAAAPVTRTFNVLQGTQTINFTQPADTLVTAGPIGLTATATSGLAVTFASNALPVCTVSGASVTLVSVGICSITASQAGNANYTAATAVTRTFNVQPAPVSADLTIAKAHVGPSFTQGGSGAYQLIVANVGGAPAVGPITVTDTLNPSLTFVSGSGGGFSCSAVGQVVTCTNPSAIGAGGVGVINLNVNVSSSAPATISNTASVACACAESNTNNNGSNTDTVPVVANITSLVTLNLSGIVTSRLGISSGTVTVTNNTATTFSGPIHLVFSNLTAGVTVISPTATTDNNAYITKVGALAPGASVTFTTRFNNQARVAVNYTPIILSGDL